jgi:hypothetical protein
MQRNKIIYLSAAAAVNCCNGFVVPFRSSSSIVVVDRHLSNPVVSHQSSTIRRYSRRRIVVIASSKNDDNEDKEEDVTSTTEDNAPIFNTNVSEGSTNNSKKDGPSTLSRITFTIYQLFSYCVQAAGAFFFIGLLLNFAGFGYTIDMEHGLVIDKIENIRNTVQFEMEIKREEREDVMKAGSSSSSSGAVGSTKLLDSYIL